MSEGNGQMSDTSDPQRSDPPQNTQGEPNQEVEADTASGGAPEDQDLTTDENGAPVDNPSGG